MTTTASDSDKLKKQFRATFINALSERIIFRLCNYRWRIYGPQRIDFETDPRASEQLCELFVWLLLISNCIPSANIYAQKWISTEASSSFFFMTRSVNRQAGQIILRNISIEEAAPCSMRERNWWKSGREIESKKKWKLGSSVTYGWAFVFSDSVFAMIAFWEEAA